ncbi:MAG TPA: zinc ABC transporter substrate-binding protein [Candidatus Babeliales bacterium]|jgi:manganese/zinc/iron transport system substrate-binding protein|nr:zinc ABC transporter substrate-binding protein [Candidatus Babeliales bacterium]
MKSIHYILGISLCGLFFLIWFSTVTYNPYENQKNNQFKVVCTTTMLADAVSVIGKSLVDVIPLMGPGIDPHMYRAREGDVHRISDAQLILYHGLHLEGKLAHLFEGMQRYVPTIAVSEAIPKVLLRQANIEGIYDPHVWHAVDLWIICIETIRDALITYDPVHADAYKYNADTYIEELRAVDLWVQQEINKIPEPIRYLVTAHDAFSYFSNRYGLQVVSLQGISTQSDIGTQDVISIVRYIVSRKIPVIFVESSVPVRAIQAVQEAAATYGWHVSIGKSLYSDALGDKQSGADTYVHMIQHNVHAIVSGLTGQLLLNE